MTKVQKFVSFLPWLILFEGISMLIGYHASPNPGNPQIHDWYASLIKSPLNPPAFVFPIMWTILYGLIAWALWRAFALHKFRNPMRGAGFWLIAIGHMISNWSWSYVFFAGQNVLQAFLWLVSVWFSALALILWLRYFDRFAAKLLIPYILWLTFAVYLNGYIVWAN